MTFLLDEDSVEVEGLPCDAIVANSMAKASCALRTAIAASRSQEWPCGHKRTPETTLTIRGNARCRICRRRRWQAGFARAVVRRRAGVHRTDAARKASAAARAIFNSSALYRPGEGNLPARELALRVAAAFGVDADALVSKRKPNYLVNARAVVVVVLRERGLSYPVIGRFLGGRDHSTIKNLSDNFDIYARRDWRVTKTYARLRDRAT